MMRVDQTSSMEWRKNWRTVFAAMVGYSLVSVATVSMSLFVEPLQREFGWSRATVTAGLLIFAAIGVPASPFAGGLVDRWGPRTVALPGIVFSALAFTAFSLADGSVMQWLALWTIYSLLEVSIKSYVWATAVANIFEASRGLAIALTLCGAAFTQMVSPIVAQHLIDAHGWRFAFAALGLGWGGATFLVVFLFFRDGRNSRRNVRVTSPEIPASPVAGLAFGEAIRTRSIQVIGAVTILQTYLIASMSVHNIPIITAIGMTRGFGALTVSLAGLGAISGKIVTGYLLDRSPSRVVGQAALTLPAISFAFMLAAGPRDYGFVILSMAIIGLAGGASLQVITYWTARYGGLRHFGKTYGLMTSGMALASGLGPVIAGALFDRFGSYAVFLWTGIPVGLLSCVLTLGLGRYPRWDLPPEPVLAR